MCTGNSKLSLLLHYIISYSPLYFYWLSLWFCVACYFFNLNLNFLFFLLSQMTSIRLDGNASCRWHQQSFRQVVNHQQRPLTVSAPPALDPSIECQQIMTTSFSHQPPPTVRGSIVDQILPMQQGNNTDNVLQQLPSNGEDVDEYQAAIQHAPHRLRKSVASMNHCDSKCVFKHAFFVSQVLTQ